MTAEITVLRQRIAKLPEAQRVIYRSLLDQALKSARSINVRDEILAKLSRRVLRAEALNARPTLTRTVS